MEKTIHLSRVISTYIDKLDIIADIHGCYHTLVDLLKQLGYKYEQGVWQHKQRLAVFLGDYIDRGVKSLETLRLIKKMADSQTAVALLGNHEYNYVAVNLPDYEQVNQYTDPQLRAQKLYFSTYRPQTKRRQHLATDLSIPPKERYSWIDWFTTLPLYLELPKLRIVHAAWDNQARLTIDQFLPNNQLADNLHLALKKGSPLQQAITLLLKGPELTDFSSLPQDLISPQMKQHSGLRIKWWLDYDKHPTLAQVIEDPMPDVPVPEQFFQIYKPYPAGEKMVIFGHYTLRGKPHIHKPNATCIDFSAYKQNYLCAYRYNGEESFLQDNLVCVPYNPQDRIV